MGETGFPFFGAANMGMASTSAEQSCFTSDRSREDAGNWFFARGSLGWPESHGVTAGGRYTSSALEPDSLPSMPNFGPMHAMHTRDTNTQGYGRRSGIAGDVGGGDGMGGGGGEFGGRSSVTL